MRRSGGRPKRFRPIREMWISDALGVLVRGLHRLGQNIVRNRCTATLSDALMYPLNSTSRRTLYES
jgi:hypothetical protein